jgi:hypothetical protein
MRLPRYSFAICVLSVTALCAGGCNREAASTPPIVGTWVVQDPNAPFPYHLYVFNADGTMQQANPDAGDPRTSDSDGKGVWRSAGGRVEGKWVELLADRATHQYVGRLELTFTITVVGDSLTATESASLFDANGASVPAPETPQPLRGARVTVH